MSYGLDEMHALLDGARAARLADEANALAFDPVVQAQKNAAAAAAERALQARIRGRDLAAHVFDLVVQMNRVAAAAYRKP